MGKHAPHPCGFYWFLISVDFTKWFENIVDPRGGGGFQYSLSSFIFNLLIWTNLWRNKHRNRNKLQSLVALHTQLCVEQPPCPLTCCLDSANPSWKGLVLGSGSFLTGRITHLSNDIIPAELVLIHDSDDNGRFPQLLCGDVEDEGLIKDWVQAPFHHYRLLLLHPFVFVHQPHLHVGVWHRKKRITSLGHNLLWRGGGVVEVPRRSTPVPRLQIL